MLTKGFTVIEILVVLTILGILTLVGGVKYTTQIEEAKLVGVQSSCAMLESLEIQERLKGRSIQGLEAEKTGGYVTREGRQSTEVQERQYSILGGKVEGKVENLGDYYIGESGVVRYYGKLRGTDAAVIGLVVGSKIQSGDYVYSYGEKWNGGMWEVSDQEGWGVRVLNQTKVEYEVVQLELEGKPVVNMQATYKGCVNMLVAPEIPPTVLDMSETFAGCTSLTSVRQIPASVTRLWRTFYDCYGLRGELLIDVTEGVVSDFCFEGAVAVGNTLVIKGNAIDRVKESVVSSQTTGNIIIWYPSVMVGQAVEVGDYVYTYLNTDSWGVRVKDITKVEYGEIQTKLYGKNITDMTSTYEGCANMLVSPDVPSKVTNMTLTYSGCSSLRVVPTIPIGVTSLSRTFANCTSIEVGVVIPNTVKNGTGLYMGCTALRTASYIPATMTILNSMFNGCTSLTGDLYVDSTTMLTTEILKGAVQTPNKLWIKGGTTETVKSRILATSTTGNVSIWYPEPAVGTLVSVNGYTYSYGKELNAVGDWVDLPAEGKGWGVSHPQELIPVPIAAELETEIQHYPVISIAYAFKGNTELVTAPRIPASIKRMQGAFINCYTLQGDLWVDSVSITQYAECLKDAVTEAGKSLVVRSADIFTSMNIAGTSNSGQVTAE